jgi:hypothetical protein
MQIFPNVRWQDTEMEDRDNIPILLEGKKVVLNWFQMESTSPMQITDWLHTEVALLLIGLPVRN